MNSGWNVLVMGCLTILAATVGIAIIFVAIIITCTLDFYCPVSFDKENVVIEPGDDTTQERNALEVSSPNTPHSIRDFSSEETALNTLRETQRLRVAYSVDTGPFSYNSTEHQQLNTEEEGDPAGLEVEMVRKFVKDTFNVSSDEDVEAIIQWKPISEFERVDAAERDDVDFVIGAISHTKERCTVPERVCTQTFHWGDNAALMVHRDSPIENFCSSALGGKNIAVISNTTSEDSSNVRVNSERFANCNPVVEYGIQVSYSTRRQAVDAVAGKNLVGNEVAQVAAYITDRRMLEFYRSEYGYEDTLKIVGASIQPEQYVFLMRKENSGLRLLLDEAVSEMLESEIWHDWLEEFHLNLEIESSIPNAFSE